MTATRAQRRLIGVGLEHYALETRPRSPHWLAYEQQVQALLAFLNEADREEAITLTATTSDGAVLCATFIRELRDYGRGIRFWHVVDDQRKTVFCGRKT